MLFFVHQYPDGYLEAEAEKKALKEKNSKATKGGKKRTLRESNASESEGDASPPGKKRKTAKTPDTKKKGKRQYLSALKTYILWVDKCIENKQKSNERIIMRPYLWLLAYAT